MPQERKTIVQKIEVVEAHVTACGKRLEEMERSLRLDHLTKKERVKMEEELKTLKKEVQANESKLGSLRKDNFKSMVVSVVIIVVAYGLYEFFYLRS